MFNLFDDDDDEQPTAIFEFESGTLCDVCGKYHADRWQCDPSIPNPWGGGEE
jgi:hypothetical protein